MNGLIFVDTNVLLYAVDQAEENKHNAAKAWREHLWNTKRGRLSFQVLQEFYANVLRRWPDSAASARLEVVDLLSWLPVSIDGWILTSGWELQDRYKISFWDSLIVAAALASNCAFLLSEDFQHGQRLGALVVVNPFRVAPGEISDDI
jgi:predicted nucleic acid-binding protein